MAIASKRKGKAGASAEPVKKKRRRGPSSSKAGPAAAESSHMGQAKEQMGPSRSVTEPDPDLPTVERVLEQAVKDIARGNRSKRRSTSNIVDNVAETLAKSLLIDIAECRRRVPEQVAPETIEESPAKQEPKNSDSQDKQVSGDDAKHDEKGNQGTVTLAVRPADMMSNSTLSDDGLEQLHNDMSLLVVEHNDSKPKSKPKRRSRSSPRRARVSKGLAQGQAPKRPSRDAKPISMAPVAGNHASPSMQRRESEYESFGIAQKPVAGEQRNREREIAITEDAVEEEILKEGMEDAGPTSYMNNNAATDLVQQPKAHKFSGLPWWQVAEIRVPESGGNITYDKVLRSFIMAVIHGCVRESWQKEALRESYDKDPSSTKGKAFASVRSALLLMERARHMGQCRTKWRPELIEALLHYRGFEWSAIEQDSSFQHFTGCEVCLGHRIATRTLHLSGPKYDARNFWPSTNVVNVLSIGARDEGSLSVAVEITGEPDAVPEPSSCMERKCERRTFSVDAQCLRKCLVFHELAHATYMLTQHAKLLIERAISGGQVAVPKLETVGGKKRPTTTERVENAILQQIDHDRAIINQRVDHYIDIVRLGDIYFAAGDAELLDAGGGSRSEDFMVRSKLYDAPLELNDDKYDVRLQRLEGLRKKSSSEEFYA